jgi:hypothetical protein
MDCGSLHPFINKGFPVRNSSRLINWIAHVRYAGKEPVWYGNLTVDADLGLEQVRSLMVADIEAHLADGFEIIDLKRGQVWLSFDD